MQVVPNYSIPFHALGKSSAGRSVAAKPQVEAVQPLKAVEKPSGVWETGTFSWRDIVDALNPLQHIPVISTIYRKLTGDQMGYASRIAGDTLFGGVVGSLISSLVSSIVNVFVDSTTGKDIGEHLVAAVKPAAPARRPAAHTQPVPAQPAQTQPVLHAAGRVTTEPVQQLPPSSMPGAGMPDVQMAIDQYKWHVYADIERKHSNYWG